jgi:hypothetical protein
MPEEQAAAPAQAGPTEFQTWAKLPDEEKDALPAAEPAKPAAETTAKPEAAKPEATDPDAPNPDAKVDEDVPKGLQKRFRELTTKIRNLESEAAAAKAAATKPAQAAAPTVATVATGAAERPKQEDFKTYEDFVEKLADWRFDQREAQRAQQQQQAAQQRAATERGNAWQTELAAARERYDDFDEVALSEMPINRATHNAIVEGGKDGAELAYWLGQNREEAAKIFKLSPIQTTLALGKILAKLSTDDEPEPAKVTRAPRPVKTVGAGAGEAIGKEPDPSDYPKWSKWNAKREALAAA